MSMSATAVKRDLRRIYEIDIWVWIEFPVRDARGMVKD